MGGVPTAQDLEGELGYQAACEYLSEVLSTFDMAHRSFTTRPRSPLAG